MKDKVLLERVGASLRKQRESSGLSQEAFADQIGMHRTYYSAIERGENNRKDSVNRVLPRFS